MILLRGIYLILDICWVSRHVLRGNHLTMTISEPTIPVIHGKETLPFCWYVSLMSRELIKTEEREVKMA